MQKDKDNEFFRRLGRNSKSVLFHYVDLLIIIFHRTFIAFFGDPARLLQCCTVNTVATISQDFSNSEERVKED